MYLVNVKPKVSEHLAKCLTRRASEAPAKNCFSDSNDSVFLAPVVECLRCVLCVAIVDLHAIQFDDTRKDVLGLRRSDDCLIRQTEERPSIDVQNELVLLNIIVKGDLPLNYVDLHPQGKYSRLGEFFANKFE